MSLLVDQLQEALQRVLTGEASPAEYIAAAIIAVLCVVIIFILIWLLYKLIVLMGKGLFWLFGVGGQKYREQRKAKLEASLSGPPAVSTNWGSSPKISLRRALSEARRLGGEDSLMIIIIAGTGGGVDDICRSLGMAPPGSGDISIAADPQNIIIDVSRAGSKRLRQLARALPWRRPTDAVVALVDQNGVPAEALSRAATFARTAGLRVALHLVLPSSSNTPAWQIIEPHRLDGGGVSRDLTADAARLWLSGRSREGLRELVLAQSSELPASLDRTLAAAPASVVDVASFCFSGAGLRAAVAQTLGRTRPASAPGISMWVGVGVFLLGVGLAVLNLTYGLDRAEQFRKTLNIAEREASTPWQVEGIVTISSPARTRRIASLSEDLAEYSGFSLLRPLAPLLPNYSAPVDLAASFLDGYILRPLSRSLEIRSRELLAPSTDPLTWIEDAQVVSEWVTSWEALVDDPAEVDMRRLFTAAFGGDETAWAEGADIALIKSGVRPSTSSEDGGFDIDTLNQVANNNLLETLNLWAEGRYTSGPAAIAARRAVDRNQKWRQQYQALISLRKALEHPSQRWLTSAEDLAEQSAEKTFLSRALGIKMFGAGTAIAAKNAIRKVRVRAREDAVDYILPGVGPLMERTGTGVGSGELTFTRETDAWLNFLDRIANAGFAEPIVSKSIHVPGVITLDIIAVAEAREKLRQFDQFAELVPVDVPPLAARKLTGDLAAELTIGIVSLIEGAIRAVRTTGDPRETADRLSGVEPALGDLVEIEEWLLQRQSLAQAERVAEIRARVASNVLAAASEVLQRENPIGIYPDPVADGNAIIRRFERGLSNFRIVHDQLAKPFIEPASGSSDRTVLEWRDISADLTAHERGDIGSNLSGIEGMLRAFAENPVEACKAPKALITGREDYVAVTLRNLRNELDFACRSRVLSAARKAYQKIASYFTRSVSELWPYSKDDSAPEITSETLSTFIGRLQNVRELLTTFDDDFALALLANSDFWGVDEEGGAVVKFKIEWRVRRGEEENAQHIIEFGVKGAEVSESGVYTWRFGNPFAFTMRLANNSNFRFVDSQTGLFWEDRRDGPGGFLRLLRVVLDGALTLEAPVVDPNSRLSGVVRATLRIRDEKNQPLSLPEFPKRVPANLFQTRQISSSRARGR